MVSRKAMTCLILYFSYKNNFILTIFCYILIIIFSQKSLYFFHLKINPDVKTNEQVPVLAKHTCANGGVMNFEKINLKCGNLNYFS